MKTMDPQTNFRELIDTYLKENCKENTYAMYSATLLDPNVKRVQILRKLFGLPAEGKAIADLTLTELQELDKKLGEYIESRKTNSSAAKDKKSSTGHLIENAECLNWKYASDIRSHLRKCIDFLENLSFENRQKETKIKKDNTLKGIQGVNTLSMAKKCLIQGEIRSISYPFDDKAKKFRKFTFVPDQEYSLEGKAKQKKAVFVPFEPEDNVEAFILPYEDELDFEIDMEAAASFPEKILGPVVLIVEKTFGFEGNAKITYKGHQIFDKFDFVEITVLKNSRNAY